VGHSEFEVETSVPALELEVDATALELEMDAASLEMEMDTAALKLEMEIGMSQEILKQERYSADYQWSMLKLLLMGQYQ
jgi:hypothetical protein